MYITDRYITYMIEQDTRIFSINMSSLFFFLFMKLDIQRGGNDVFAERFFVMLPPIASLLMVGIVERGGGGEF